MSLWALRHEIELQSHVHTTVARFVPIHWEPIVGGSPGSKMAHVLVGSIYVSDFRLSSSVEKHSSRRLTKLRGATTGAFSTCQSFGRDAF